MRARFRTSEVLCLLEFRAPNPPKNTPQFRLQNFLLRRKDWKTLRAASLHIGEQGELITLREILGRRLKKIENIRNSHSEKIYQRELRKKNGATSLRFPTQRDFWAYVKKVEVVLGKEMTLKV